MSEHDMIDEQNTQPELFYLQIINQRVSFSMDLRRDNSKVYIILSVCSGFSEAELNM